MIHWIVLSIQVLVLIVTIVLAWGKIGTAIALLNQRIDSVDGRLDKLENNHLRHIELDIKCIKDELRSFREWVIRREERETFNKK